MNDDDFSNEVEQVVQDISHVLHNKELSTCMAALAAMLVTVAKQLPMTDDQDTFIDPRERCMLAVLSAAWDSNVITPSFNLQ